MEVGEMLLEALKLMGLGVGGVFLVLSIFFFLIRGLMVAFPQKKTEQENGGEGKG